MTTAQKQKKFSRKLFAFLNAFYPKTHLIQSLNSFDSSRTYGRLLENQKTRGSKALFLPKNDFQNSSTKTFRKKHPDFGSRAWKPIEDMKFRLFAHAHMHNFLHI